VVAVASAVPVSLLVSMPRKVTTRDERGPLAPVTHSSSTRAELAGVSKEDRPTYDGANTVTLPDSSWSARACGVVMLESAIRVTTKTHLPLACRNGTDR
jgi:hypothetical protein